jgi:hypothetical protein
MGHFLIEFSKYFHVQASENVFTLTYHHKVNIKYTINIVTCKDKKCLHEKNKTKPKKIFE